MHISTIESGKEARILNALAKIKSNLTQTKHDSRLCESLISKS
ncbi:hypothetical protein [Helicobacter sp. T3_23-1059]